MFSHVASWGISRKPQNNMATPLFSRQTPPFCLTPALFLAKIFRPPISINIGKDHPLYEGRGGEYTKPQLGNFCKKTLQWRPNGDFLWPKSLIIRLLGLLLWSSNFSVFLVWFLNLFGAKALLSSLLKKQQATIRKFSWKTLAEESTDLFTK